MAETLVVSLLEVTFCCWICLFPRDSIESTEYISIKEKLQYRRLISIFTISVAKRNLPLDEMCSVGMINQLLLCKFENTRDSTLRVRKTYKLIRVK